MSHTNADQPKRPWHRWVVGPILVIQALIEGANIAGALALDSAAAPTAGLPELPPGALDYYAALAPWEHVVGGVYVALLLVTGIAVMAWASWGRTAIAARGAIHVGYFGWHLATSTYLAVFGPVGFAISTALLLATLAYVFALTPRSGRKS